MTPADRVVVFVGPTLPVSRAQRVLDATYLPPAAQGDLYAAARGGARLVGLIDGVFESVPAVWHKEILWALARGVHVFGSASMGALRAAETDAFGTVGVGAIYRAYRHGTIEDDDEVAVVHGPVDSGYRPLSEAMVNIRATLGAAVRARVLSRRAARALETQAKSLYYPERTWATLLATAPDLGLSPGGVARLRRWLPRGRVDQKGADAIRMLRRMRAARVAGSPPRRVGFTFEHTVFWDAVTRRVHLARPDAS